VTDDSPLIQLDQFLKLNGLVTTGGAAKHRIQAGEVEVNGEVETRRKRKLRRGDRVELGGEALVVDDSTLQA
jgi:ribosome-associated protein